jgi:hypothetical protein
MGYQQGSELLAGAVQGLSHAGVGQAIAERGSTPRPQDTPNLTFEDDAGKAVRTLAVWGDAPKYLRDLSDWWKIGKGDADLVKAVTRATRGPGKYNLVWDGKDDKGNALPQGTYTVRVEVHREHGKHLRQSGKIDCKEDDAAVKLDKNEEAGETAVEYGKKKSS